MPKARARRQALGFSIWDFPKIWVPYFGVLIIRVLLFRI